MVRKDDDQPRTPAGPGKKPTRWEKLVENYGATMVPVGLLAAVVALMVYGMCAPH